MSKPIVRGRAQIRLSFAAWGSTWLGNEHEHGLGMIMGWCTLSCAYAAWCEGQMTNDAVDMYCTAFARKTQQLSAVVGFSQHTTPATGSNEHRHEPSVAQGNVWETVNTAKTSITQTLRCLLLQTAIMLQADKPE